MALWAAILITVVASTACSVGKALQKEGTRQLPCMSFERKILQQYLKNSSWLAGLGLDLGGGALQVTGFALAPVSIIQPISGVGLVGLALYSHFFLREHLRPLEWCAVALAALGTVGLGATGSGEGDGSQPRNSAVHMVSVLAALVVLVACVSLVRRTARRQGQRRHAHHPPQGAGAGGGGGGSSGNRTGAAVYGLQAGACFGLSAATCRTGFLLSQQHRLWPFAGLAGSMALSGYGFVLQTVGLKEGNTVVVCTLAAVSAMVLGVAVGVLGLGESLGGLSSGALASRVASWVAIAVGVSSLAGGAGASRELAAWALAQLPASAWRRLPLGLAVRLKGWAAAADGGVGELPQHHKHKGHTGDAAL